MRSLSDRQWRHWLLALMAIIPLLIVASGTAASPTSAPPDTTAPTEPADTPSNAPQTSESTPTATGGAPAPSPELTPTPGAVIEVRDTVVLVTNTGPDQLGAWSSACSGNVPSLVYEDLASDPLTWIDSTSFEVVPLSGVESWEQIEPNRWRFHLREGVTFHNGEPWNAAAAKMGIDFHGDKELLGTALVPMVSMAL
jgi:ABC-type transport system substrate-binding protein